MTGTSPEAAPPVPARRRPVPMARKIAAGVLVAVAIVVPLLVNTYASEKPRLWGFPFFFWYQLMWVLISAAVTFAAYLLIEGRRR
ncbi:MAG: DUF3311 domain-containing protein [Jatrophihabitans sp.]|nr:MAG: DUF3311 domain-containing protein [Jatrophihabitans sp.]